MASYNALARRGDLIERTLGMVTRFLNTAVERRTKHRTYRDTLAELQTLSNRELADLGLHRSELKRIAWESAHSAKAH